jgi:hypothetical protein
MKKDVAMFEKGVIVDFAGAQHQFVVCALSTSAFQSEEASVELVSFDNASGAEIDNYTLPRAVFIGVAVCNPGDEWDEEKGKMIALNKAKGFKADKVEKAVALFATRAGLISEPMVKALLQKEVQHIIEDPEYVIKGYNQMKKRYELDQEMKKFIEEAPSNVKELVDQFVALNDKDKETAVNLMFLRANE